MFAALFSWLASGGLAAIGRELRAAHEAKLRAANDSERIAADVRIRGLEARQASILAAQGDRFERWVRIAFAVPFVVYIWKLVLWDKVLGLGATDALSPMLADIMWIVIGGYFLVSTARVIRK